MYNNASTDKVWPNWSGPLTATSLGGLGYQVASPNESQTQPKVQPTAFSAVPRFAWVRWVCQIKKRRNEGPQCQWRRIPALKPLVNPLSPVPHLTWPLVVVAAEHRRRWWSSPQSARDVLDESVYEGSEAPPPGPLWATGRTFRQTS